MLVIAVVALAAGVLYVGAGGFTTVAGAVGSTLTGFVQDVTATPIPSATPVPKAKSPSIVSPSEPYTNQDSVDLQVTVPTGVVGDPDYRLRVYLALEDQDPAPIQETPLATGPQTIVPVELTEGINDFTVSLIGPGGESESSPVVRFVLDTKKPSIKLTRAKDGATINRKAVDLEGRSQGRSTLIARNQTTGDSIVGTADGDGHFALRLPIAMGGNRITIAATDPAGNANDTEIRVTRGSGKLGAPAGVLDYSIKRSALPEPIRLTVTVDDPDGKPLDGARVTFTLSIPGVKHRDRRRRHRCERASGLPDHHPRGRGPGRRQSRRVLVRTSGFGTAPTDATITIRK